MNYKTHVVTGTVCALGFYYVTKDLNLPTYGSEYILGAVVGSLLPDIDHPKSFLGDVMPIPLIKHRTITHSIFFALAISLCAGILFSLFACFGVFIGVISHLALDMLTGYGVSLFAPITYKRIGLFSLFRE